MKFNCCSLNEFFCVYGPEFIDVDDTPIYANTGWGKKGWNHTDEAKEAISRANTKYSLDEKIEATRAINRRRAKKWFEKNPEKRSEYSLKYREKNKEKIKEYQEKYRKENKEKIKERDKKYYENKKNKYKST